MSILIVSYELNSKTKDYQPLEEAIKENSNGWSHYIDTLWIVNTSLTANDFVEKLLPHIDKRSDFLYVAKITSQHQGWLPTEAWEWFKKAKY